MAAHVVRARCAVGVALLTLIGSFALGCSSEGGRTRSGGMIGIPDNTAVDAGAIRNPNSGPQNPDDFPTQPGETCGKMDILFVIDDSGSMAEEQGNLASNFPRFVEVLETFMTGGGGSIDYRIGVTTTGKDVTTIVEFNSPSLPFPLPPMSIVEQGADGALQQGANCGMTERWLNRGEPDVPGTFSCVAQVGTTGPGVEMPLQSLELALVDRMEDGTNAGFLREDALLAVVILTDEDDCSRLDDPIRMSLELPDLSMIADPAQLNMLLSGAIDICDKDGENIQPLQRYVDMLDSVKGDRSRWAMAVIAGPGPGTCSSSFGDATDATRLREFLDLAGDNTSFSSICEGDLSGALNDALETFQVACEEFILI